jgi:hypothetical protein
MGNVGGAAKNPVQGAASLRMTAAADEYSNRLTTY